MATFAVEPCGRTYAREPLAGKFRNADLSVSAAIFASTVVADMGGDPYAGLKLIERMDARHVAAERVVLDAEQRAAVRIYLDERPAIR